MINGDRSTVQITHHDGPAPVRFCNDRWTLEDSLGCEMLEYRQHHKKPVEQNSKVDVMVYFSVDGKTLRKITTAIDAKDYFDGYHDVENFANVILHPTLVGICKKILEIIGDKELTEYIICIDQSL
jgi:hypothetical protein